MLITIEEWLEVDKFGKSRRRFVIEAESPAEAKKAYGEMKEWSDDPLIGDDFDMEEKNAAKQN